MYNLFKKLLPTLKSIFLGSSVPAVVSGEQNKIYIRFAIVNDNLGTVRNAELHLVVAENTGGGTKVIEVYGLNNNDAEEVWNEDVITFNDAPANDVDNTFEVARVTLLGSFNVASEAAGTLKIFTSTDMITWLNTDSNDTVTFLLRRTDSNFSSILYFASSESTTYEGPKLVINKDTLNMYVSGEPEPTKGYQNLTAHGF